MSSSSIQGSDIRMVCVSKYSSMAGPRDVLTRCGLLLCGCSLDRSSARPASFFLTIVTMSPTTFSLSRFSSQLTYTSSLSSRQTMARSSTQSSVDVAVTDAPRSANSDVDDSSSSGNAMVGDMCGGSGGCVTATRVSVREPGKL